MACATSMGCPSPARQSLSLVFHQPSRGMLQTGTLPRCRQVRGLRWVCEGAFDVLALLAAGVSHVVAIFGVQG